MPDDPNGEHERDPHRSYGRSDQDRRSFGRITPDVEREVQQIVLDLFQGTLGWRLADADRVDALVDRMRLLKEMCDRGDALDLLQWARERRAREKRDGETVRTTGISRMMNGLFYVISAGLGAAISTALGMLGAHRP